MSEALSRVVSVGRVAAQTETDEFLSRSLEMVVLQNELLAQKASVLYRENRALRQGVYALTTQVQTIKALGESKPSLHSVEERVVIPVNEGSVHLGAAVHCVEYSPSATHIACAGADRSLSLWTPSGDNSRLDLNAIEEGNCVRVEGAHENLIHTVSWLKKSPKILSCSLDGVVKLWDISSGISGTMSASVFMSSAQEGYCRSCTVGDDEKGDGEIVFVGSSRGSILGFDTRVAPGKPMFSIDNSSSCSQLYVSSEYLLSGDSSGFVKKWDLRTLDTCEEIAFDSPISNFSVCSGFVFANCKDGVHASTFEKDALISKPQCLWKHFAPGLRFGLLARYLKSEKQKLVLVGTGCLSSGSFAVCSIKEGGIDILSQQSMASLERIYHIGIHPSAPFVVTGSSDSLCKIWAVRTSNL